MNPCGRMGDGRELFLRDGEVVVKAGAGYYPARRSAPLRYAIGIGPLREGSMDPPRRASDFCDCERGSVACQWFEAGLTILPALAESAPDCDFCEPTSGLIYWRGYFTERGDYCTLWKQVPRERA